MKQANIGGYAIRSCVIFSQINKKGGTAATSEFKTRGGSVDI